jgi:UrcA family protein
MIPRFLTRATSAALAALALATATAPALANEPVISSVKSDGTTVRSQAVPYRDLDLASDSGRAAFDKRVRTASWQVCHFRDVTLAERQACRVNTYRQARPEMVAAVENANGQQLALNLRK